MITSFISNEELNSKRGVHLVPLIA